jgi:Acyl-CoA dehydrogenase, C-terminal domain
VCFECRCRSRWGGPEVDIITQIEVIEALAAADGSAGWCATIGGDAGFYTARLDDGAGLTLYPSLDAVTAGFIQPIGRLDSVDGGYRLSGRWPFGSGCAHADVIVAGPTVSIGVTAGSPPTASLSGASRCFRRNVTRFSTPGTRRVCAAPAATTIASMAASFRPSTFTFRDQPRDGALYAWPGLFIARLNGVSLGIAAGALEAAESMVADKVLMPERRPARDDTRVRTDIARAEALVGSARSYAIDVIGDVWATLKAGDEPSRRQRAALAGTTSTPHERVVRQCNW